MTSKERVLRAFHRIAGLPDRPPLQFDLCRQLTERFQAELGIKAEYSPSYYEDLTYRISANAIRTALGSDCVVVGGTVPAGYAPERVRDDITLNEFGMEMKPTALYVEVVKCPLKDASSVEDVRKYPFPDAYAPGRFAAAERDIALFGKDYFVIGDCELSVFELAWHLTGMQEYLLALAMEETWIEALNDRVETWTLGIATQLVERGVDAIWFGEDLGSQTSTLISPDMWRDKFKPRYARMISALKKINPSVMIIMHSDGAVAPLIDDFIEMGIEVYNPVQPNVAGSDPRELADRYGGRINFFGGIDQQELLPSGDLPALEAEIRRRAEILGAGGGYLMAPAHIIQADTAPETVVAMIEAVKSLGLRGAITT
jgi:uroporphyrinogen decarboxylase